MTGYLSEKRRLWSSLHPLTRSVLDRLVGGSAGTGACSDLPSSTPDRLVRGAGSGVHLILLSPFFALSRNTLNGYLDTLMKPLLDERPAGGTVLSEYGV